MLKFALLCMVVGGVLIFFAKDINPYLESKSISKPCFYVQASELNLREKPTIEADIQGRLEYNAKICEYSKIENGFLRVSGGWVFAEYLSLNPAVPKKSILPPQKETIVKISQETLPQAKLPQEKSKKIILASHPKDSKEDWLDQAEALLAKENYQAAKTLALKANQENPQNLGSWEVFAKGLYLEGKKTEAIEVLEYVLQTYYDEKLVLLLTQMQGNKI